LRDCNVLGRSLLLAIWQPDGSTYRLPERAVNLGLNAQPLLLVRYGAAALKQALLLRFQTASRIMRQGVRCQPNRFVEIGVASSQLISNRAITSMSSQRTLQLS
jgi:hypothetical protein